MRMDELGVETLLRHKSGCAMRRAFAFAAYAEHINVVAHEISDIYQRRFMGKRCETDASTAI